MGRKWAYLAMISAILASSSGCDRSPRGTPPGLSSPVTPTSTLYRNERHSLAVQIPGRWTFQEPQSQSSGYGVLFEAQSGTKLTATLSWQTGGMPMQAAVDACLEGMKQKVHKLEITKRQPFISGGLRVDLLTPIGLPETLRWVVAIFIHQGRLYTVMVWTLEGDWNFYSAEIETFLASIELSTPAEVSSGKDTPTLVSDRHGFELTLPSEWTGVHVDPPDGPVVARLWTGGGFPYGQILAVEVKEGCSAYIDALLKFSGNSGPLEALHKTGDESDCSASYIAVLGNVKYFNMLRGIKSKSKIVLLQLYTRQDDAGVNKDTLLEIARSLHSR